MLCFYFSDPEQILEALRNTCFPFKKSGGRNMQNREGSYSLIGMLFYIV